MSDNYPFDRDHWMVDVSFPVSLLGDKEAVLGEVDRLAESRGGRPYMRVEPAPGYVGKPGFDTFGCSIAFEAHDANTESFVRLVQSKLSHLGATVSFDPDTVFGPDEEPEASTGPRR